MPAESCPELLLRRVCSSFVSQGALFSFLPSFQAQKHLPLDTHAARVMTTGSGISISEAGDARHPAERYMHPHLS